MHVSASTGPQAMSNDHNYRPRSPELSGFADQQPPPRLHRLPSYQIEEPNVPQGYSFSPRGSYDASPFFSPSAQQPSTSYFGQRATPQATQLTSPPQFTPASLPQQQSQPKSAFYHPYASSPPRQSHQSIFAAQTSPYQPLHIVPPTQQFLSNHQAQTFDDDMARLRTRKPVNYNDSQNDMVQYDEPASYIPPPPAAVQPPPPPQFMQLAPVPDYGQQSYHKQQPQQQQQQQQQQQHQPHLSQVVLPQASAPPAIPSNIDVRTKFPVARIKRIMQADEDVGKVAQATPTAVSKALELFMIALVTKGAIEAKSLNQKRVTATHLKTALLNDPQFDFLNDICESVPDEGSKKARSKSETKSEHDDMDSDDDMGAAAKKKGKTKKPHRKGTSEGDSD